MRTIHIQGIAKDINLNMEFERYDLGWGFAYGEETRDKIDNVFIRIYDTKNRSTLDEAIEGNLIQLFGSLEGTGEEYGYSEYTITGFNIWDLKIGGHDLQEILNNIGSKYVHILVDITNI